MNNLKVECEWYLKELAKLQKSNKHRGGELELAYHPHAFDGRKICFGYNNKHYTQKEMVLQLIASDSTDDFINYLKNKALPLFQNGCLTIPDFHF